MSLLLAAPFFIITIIMGFWAKKHPAEKSFNRFILITLAIIGLGSSFIYQAAAITLNSFVISIALLYIANLVENKYAVKLFEVLGLSAILFAGFAFNTSLENLAIIAAFILMLYYGLNSYKNEVTFSMIHMMPLGAAALYFNTTNLPYMFAFLALFACGRYFVENKATKMPKFYLQSFLAVLALGLVSVDNEQTVSSIIILLAGCSFMILSQLLDAILRSKKTIINRLFDQHEIRFMVTVKILAFNATAIALAFIYSLGYISIYILIAYIIIVLTYGYAKMWYLENEDKFKY